MTPPAAVAWGAQFGWLPLAGTSLQFLSHPVTAWILGACMVGELVADKLPRTPSRTKPGPFVARIVLGGLAGAALVLGSEGSAIAGALMGGLGAVAGTLLGFRARTGLVRVLGVPDYAVALAEDVIAVGAAFVIVAL